MRSLKMYLMLATLLTASNFLSGSYYSGGKYFEWEKKSIADQTEYDKRVAEKAAADKIAAQEAAERAKRWHCTITSKCVVVREKDKEYEVHTSRYTSPAQHGMRTRYTTSRGTITYDCYNCCFVFSKSEYEIYDDEGSCIRVYRRPEEPNT